MVALLFLLYRARNSRIFGTLVLYLTVEKFNNNRNLHLLMYFVKYSELDLQLREHTSVKLMCLHVMSRFQNVLIVFLNIFFPILKFTMFITFTALEITCSPYTVNSDKLRFIKVLAIYLTEPKKKQSSFGPISSCCQQFCHVPYCTHFIVQSLKPHTNYTKF